MRYLVKFKNLGRRIIKRRGTSSNSENLDREITESRDTSSKSEILGN